ncbi:MAG: hypothetical protein HGA49_06220 [Eubacteriaceae bacterium]|nr:hypothetical protein [Eubacteriaceae bacterium]
MLRFDFTRDYKGTGASKGLDRGLLVYYDNELLLEEGMGIGACAIQTGGYTYFASVVSIEYIGSAIHVNSNINRRLEFTVSGTRFKPLTKFLEFFSTKVYMKLEKSQSRLLSLGSHLSKIFNVGMTFVKTLTLGEIRTVYETGDYFLTVDLSCNFNAHDSKLFVMNELGGSLFQQGLIGGKVTSPPSGWQRVYSTCELYNHRHSLAFSMEEMKVPENVSTAIYWGREKTSQFSWAGFESEISCQSKAFEHYRYAIFFREVENQT